MKKRQLSNSHLKVSAIGLGCMGMSFGYGPAGEKNEMIKIIRGAVEQFAQKRHATPAQIAIVWVLAQKPWIVPIPGTTKLHRVTENNEAVSIKLTAKELKDIEAASAQIEVIGTRYTEAMEKSTGL